MDHEENTFREISIALAKHFDSLYYIDIETGNYEEFIHMDSKGNPDYFGGIIIPQ